ncbi:Hypothetical predicted protein [Olea europaea subsp. europaea]|uniref:Uncharacterized protein n=2 Tax=Olea europaea subsp. europaea TaxID=158383 RepID=A0A8S0ST75_OLEEU|nr:Hypothetical predicted protein [Olea europaea subsp. europaea]
MITQFDFAPIQNCYFVVANTSHFAIPRLYYKSICLMQKFEELDELHAQVEELSPEMEEINDDIDAKWEEIDAKRKVIEAKWEEIGAMHKEIVATVEARKSRGKEYKDRERRKRRTWMSLLMES